MTAAQYPPQWRAARIFELALDREHLGRPQLSRDLALYLAGRAPDASALAAWDQLCQHADQLDHQWTVADYVEPDDPCSAEQYHRRTVQHISDAVDELMPLDGDLRLLVYPWAIEHALDERRMYQRIFDLRTKASA